MSPQWRHDNESTIAGKMLCGEAQRNRALCQMSEHVAKDDCMVAFAVQRRPNKDMRDAFRSTSAVEHSRSVADHLGDDGVFRFLTDYRHVPADDLTSVRGEFRSVLGVLALSLSVANEGGCAKERLRFR
jgi:hypothetical protein